MEKQVIRCRIDVSKIDKKRLHKGEKGTWYDFAVIESKTQYNDFVIIEEITAEERKSGEKGTIIGNGKYPAKKEETVADDKIPF